MPFYLSAAEREVIRAMQETFGLTEIEATEKHLESKRELAWIHACRGNRALAEQLLKEMDEWSTEIEEELDKIAPVVPKPKKIFLPND